jgi:penicillin-insensitive murein DD-endopeptidase
MLNFLNCYRFSLSSKPRSRLRLTIALAAIAWGFAAAPSLAQDIPATEAARRTALIAALPPDAAKRVFGLIGEPSTAPPRSIGSYTKGCIAGAAPLPQEGATWQVMRPARNRFWGHPVLIAVIERIAAGLPAGWPGLLVGDIGQPRGGPMVTGHASHQIGLDADIWLTPMPVQRLSAVERDNMPAKSIVAVDGNDVDPAVWGPQFRQLIEAVARAPEPARMFVNPAIKRALCREAGVDRAWLAKVRPWWGHDDHFHIRLNCPSGQALCEAQDAVPPGDGCGKELDWWFTDEARHPKPSPPGKPLLVSQLPPDCAAVATAK